MTRILASALGFSLLAGTAMAGPDCSDIPHDMAMWEIVKAFEDGEGTVKLAKVTSGNCFEIYGTIDETKYEIYYNPQTGEEMERVEG